MTEVVMLAKQAKVNKFAMAVSFLLALPLALYMVLDLYLVSGYGNGYLVLSLPGH